MTATMEVSRALSARRGRRRILLVLWAAVGVTFLAFLATGLLGRRGTVELDDYASAVAASLAGVACLWRRRQCDGQSRRAWLLLGFSALSWSGGGAIWTVYEVYLGRAVPFPSLADVGYLLAAPLAVAALLSFPGTPVVGAARLRPLLDGVIAAGALLFVSWTVVLGPAFHAGTGSVFSQTVSLAYPVGDVLTATMALLALARVRGERRSTMVLVGIGLMIVAVADSSFTWFIAHNDYTTGNLFDTGYVSGYLLIAVAALWTSRAGAPDPDKTDSETTDTYTVAPGRLALYLPYAPLLISTPLAAAVQLSGHSIGPFQVDVSLIVVLAILVRQLLSLRVISALSGQLHETVKTLGRREVELHFQAFHDPLTGLANRALFADRAGHALAGSRHAGPVVLLLADLDDFKTVNDTMGHAAGDALLVAVAERLRAVVRPGDTVARLGGDEFAVLLEAPDGLAGARQVADRITETLLAPFHLGGGHTVIAASVGIAVAGESTSGEALMRDADVAMYAAKARGTGGHVLYAAELDVAHTGRQQLKSDLGEAITGNELTLRYQPIIDLATGQLTGVEALLRWTHPVQGPIPPAEFIPLAEASGAILPIGRWVIAHACAQAGRWKDDRPDSRPPLQLAVNISGRQLSDPQLIPAVQAALGAANLPPNLLTLEITEGVLVDDETTLTALLAFRTLGVHLAIDDFGTGHSTLSRLRRYPIDTLKIDRSFIAAITSNAPAPDVFIAAILALGHGLGMNIIAEGVETDEQLIALCAMGCPQAQGFLFSRPVDPDVITELIAAGTTLTDAANA